MVNLGLYFVCLHLLLSAIPLTTVRAAVLSILEEIICILYFPLRQHKA